MLTRRGVLKGLTALVASGLATAAYGFGVEAPSTRITRYAFTPAGWPKGYRLKVAVLTDMHVIEPWMGLARLQSIVQAANALQPDVALLLGDYAAGHHIRRLGRLVAPAAWAAELAKLSAPLGIHAVLGNHDYWDDRAAQRRQAGPTEAHGALAGAGIPVYENKAVRLAHAGGAFWLAGLGDQWAFVPPGRSRLGRGIGYRGVDDLPATMRQITDSAPVILMAHEPDIFPTVPARVSLTLSGHTHGGQINAFGYSPMIPSRYGMRYMYGHIVENGRDLIVSAGLGCSLMPVRIGAPPEIVLIELGVYAGRFYRPAQCCSVQVCRLGQASSFVRLRHAFDLACLQRHDVVGDFEPM